MASGANRHTPRVGRRAAIAGAALTVAVVVIVARMGPVPTSARQLTAPGIPDSPTSTDDLPTSVPVGPSENGNVGAATTTTDHTQSTRPRSADGNAPANDPAPAAPAVGPGSVETMQLPVPGEARSAAVMVYRPAVDDTPALPVVYFLHGLPGRAADVFDAGAKELLDRLFAEGVPPFVLVAPDGNGTHHDDTEWANAVDGTDQLETWVADTVRKAVERGNVRDPANRSIAGFSMGGYGAMNIALRHADLYTKVATIAGYFHVDDPDGMFGHDPAIERANTPLANLDKARGLRIALFDGDRDTESGVSGQSTLFHDALAGRGIQSELDISPGSHSWDYASSVLEDVFRFLTEH